MTKGLTILGMIVAALILIVFGLDIAAKIPFQQASIPMDITFVVCALCLGYLSWSAFRELD